MRSIPEFLSLLLVAGIIGSIGQRIAGSRRGGCLVAIAIGFVGALLGAWLGRQLNLPDPFVISIGASRIAVVWSIIGAALFVAVISFLTRGRRE
jgi:uncharacterized membrane protein YeaQ/YmgE (transglycosylase-associated protein family)